MYIYDVFHVSMIRQYIPNMNCILDWDYLHFEEDVYLSLDPMRILQHQRLTLSGQDIEKVRVQWDSNDETLANWDDALRLKDMYPYLLVGF